MRVNWLLVLSVVALCVCVGQGDHDGGDGGGGSTCVAFEASGAVPDNLYNVQQKVRKVKGARALKKAVKVFGLDLVGEGKVKPGAFCWLARVVTEILGASAPDQSLQKSVIRALYEHKVTGPVVSREKTLDSVPGRFFYGRSVCDIIMVFQREGQISEVLEHVLHFLLIGQSFAFPDDWSLEASSITSTTAWAAMQQAINRGVYNAALYDDIDEEYERQRILLQEFHWWLTGASWNLLADGEFDFGVPDEWSVNTLTELQSKLPLAYDLFMQTSNQVFVKPSLETLRSLASLKNRNPKPCTMPKTEDRSEDGGPSPTPSPAPVSTPSSPPSPTTGFTPPDFKVSSPPKSIGRIKKNGWVKYANVWGIHIVAKANVADRLIIHTAKVLAEQLDRDMDGQPDSVEIIKSMQKNKAAMFMPSGMCNSGPGREIDRLGWAAQCLGGREISTTPGDREDATFEETHHLIYDTALKVLYPNLVSPAFKASSELTKIMDVARGGKFKRPPKKYPATAWYTYYDRTCDYDCQAGEFIWWAVSSLTGFNDPRCTPGEDIYEEFRPCTKQKLKSVSPQLVELVENPKLFLLIDRYPTGKYP